jgi:YbbR domain-containing protein
LANAEEYNDNLHEEMHQLHNQLHPFVPHGAAKMEPSVIAVDDDLEAEEDQEMEENESMNEDDNVSEMDSDHDE